MREKSTFKICFECLPAYPRVSSPVFSFPRQLQVGSSEAVVVVHAAAVVVHFVDLRRRNRSQRNQLEVVDDQVRRIGEQRRRRRVLRRSRFLESRIAASSDVD